MKETAVDWFSEKTFNQIELLKRGYVNQEEFLSGMLKLRDQAKEMEKEQMRLVHKNGYDNSQYRHDCNYGGVEYWDSVPRPFEGYYNETFNTNEK